MATRITLLLGAKQRADQESSNFIGTDEGYKLVNDAIRELYKLMVHVDHNAFSSTATLVYASSDNGAKSLPADFYQMRGLDLDATTDVPRTIPAFTMRDRNTHGYRGYMIRGTQLLIYPKSTAPGTYQIIYTPVPPELASDGDALDARLVPYIDFIEVAAAIDMAIKEESDPSALMAKKDALIKRIEIEAVPPDSMEPPLPPPQTADCTWPFMDWQR